MRKNNIPENTREALELALYLAVTAPDDERMIEAAGVSLQLCRLLPEDEVAEAMAAVEQRLHDEDEEGCDECITIQ